MEYKANCKLGVCALTKDLLLVRRDGRGVCVPGTWRASHSREDSLRCASPGCKTVVKVDFPE